MKRQLFAPFRLAQWVRLALVGFLAGEMGGGGSFLRIPLNVSNSRSTQQFQGPFGAGGGALLVLGIGLAIVLGLVVLLALTYISSRMRFVLFDSVVQGECRIREFWSRRREPALRYFLFQLLFGLAALISMGVLIGAPLLFAFSRGWQRDPGQHLVGLVLGGSLLFFVFVAWIIVFALVQVLTKDFIVPMMALDNLTVSEAWNRLRSMIDPEKGSYAGYIGMKILLALGAAIITGIVGFAVLLILLIPIGGIGLISILGGRAAGLSWNPVTVAIAIVAAAIIVLALFLLSALISVPVIVFLPAYSIYFFAERYPPLYALMYPQPNSLSPQP
jgi:hypothetical protein